MLPDEGELALSCADNPLLLDAKQIELQKPLVIHVVSVQVGAANGALRRVVAAMLDRPLPMHAVLTTAAASRPAAAGLRLTWWSGTRLSYGALLLFWG